MSEPTLNPPCRPAPSSGGRVGSGDRAMQCGFVELGGELDWPQEPEQRAAVPELLRLEPAAPLSAEVEDPAVLATNHSSSACDWSWRAT